MDDDNEVLKEMSLPNLLDFFVAVNLVLLNLVIILELLFHPFQLALPYANPAPAVEILLNGSELEELLPMDEEL